MVDLPNVKALSTIPTFTDPIAARPTFLQLAAQTGSNLLGFMSNGVGAVLRNALSKLQEVSTPEDFGCVGDYYLDNGSINPTPTDDSVNFQKALTALKVGQKLRLNKGYYLGNKSVVINTRLATLEGPGAICAGTLIVGVVAATIDYQLCIDGVTFDGGSVAAGAGTLEGISFRRARRVVITRCKFNNLNIGVSVPAFAEQTTHATAMIRVTACDFTNVNYAWYNDHNDQGTIPWQHTSDCSFIGNTINLSYITGVYAKGIDGFHVSDNVFFNYSFNSSDAALKAKKENNIYIGQSDWVHVTGNNLFEAGSESIILNQPKNFVISHNLIAWCGQKIPASAIKLMGSSTTYGMITNNRLSRFTKHGIEVLTNLDSVTYSIVTTRGNSYEYLATTNTYYGTTDLTTIDHYAVYQPANSPTIVEDSGGAVAGVDGNMIQGSPSSMVRFSYSSRIEGYRAAISVTAANTPIAVLSNRAPGETISYSAQLVVIARQGSTQNGNLGSYILHVTKAPTVGSIALISAQGLINATSSTNWPSFTFTFDATTNQLRASPVGSTSGTFYFDITCVGSVRLFKP